MQHNYIIIAFKLNYSYSKAKAGFKSRIIQWYLAIIFIQ